MFKFFNRTPKDGLIRNQIELISVHIPKVAGTSFQNTLIEEYGKKAIARLDINLTTHQFRINRVPFDQFQLEQEIKVVHGHFSPILFQERFETHSGIPIITWLRDPVERVLSNYFYLKKMAASKEKTPIGSRSGGRRVKGGLLDYAEKTVNRNRMSKFLEGSQLEELHFVGILEFYSEDLKFLADLLAWKSCKLVHYNQTGNPQRDSVSEEERAAIAELNEKDVALYQKALKMRRERLKIQL